MARPRLSVGLSWRLSRCSWARRRSRNSARSSATSRRARRPMCRASRRPIFRAGKAIPGRSQPAPPPDIRSDQPPARPLPAPMSLPPSSRPGGGTIQSQPLAPPPGTEAAPQPPAQESISSKAPPAVRPHAARSAARRAPAARHAAAGQYRAAAGRRGGGRAAAATHQQSDRGIFRPRQDHRPHHLVRRRHQRDRAVRRAAGDAARVLFAPADRDAEHRRLCRSRRGDAARRDQAHFHRLDVRGQPRPARGRASGLRRVGHRLQRRAGSGRGGSAERCQAARAHAAAAEAATAAHRRRRNRSSARAAAAFRSAGVRDCRADDRAPRRR